MALLQKSEKFLTFGTRRIKIFSLFSPLTAIATLSPPNASGKKQEENGDSREFAFFIHHAHSPPY